MVPGSSESGLSKCVWSPTMVLRSLVRRLLRHHDTTLDHLIISQERKRMEDVQNRMERLRRKHPDKPREYFLETHDIHPDDWE